METYLVPAGFGEAEYIEKRSRFIGRVWCAENEAEALSHIADMRKKHYDATHNVYAYILREGIMRYSDDGEPGGTSGQPTLNVFRSEGITNVCCVITRYFGGTLLGAGGLVRAYSATAKLALDAAGITQMSLWKSYGLACSYAQYEKVKRLLDSFGAVINDTDYGVEIKLDVLIIEEKALAFIDELTQLSAGSIAACETGESFCGVQIK